MKRIKPTISQHAVAICQRCSDFIITSKVQFSHCVSAANVAQEDFKADKLKQVFLAKIPRSEPSFMLYLVSLIHLDFNNTIDNK